MKQHCKSCRYVYEDCSENDVNHPTHYTNRKAECWYWYEQAMSEEEFVGAMKNNIWKYTYRCGHKDDNIKDLEKAKAYIDRWIKFIKDMANDN